MVFSGDCPKRAKPLKGYEGHSGTKTEGGHWGVAKGSSVSDIS